jgi:glycosyltransferase involved in cell wall biosynthesis
MREEHPEVILSIAHKPIVYSAIAARWAKGPKIYALLCGLGYAFTDSNSGTLRYVLARFMLTRLYLLVRGYTAGLIYQNPDDERDILKSGLFTGDVRRMRMRGAGVMLERFKYIPYPHGNAFVFLLIARLLADKGIREYAKAAMRVRALYPNSEFHIVGSVDSNPTSVSLAEVQSWAKAGGIEYHGEQSDVRPYLARCHAYVLPSYREGTPQTSLEAMATGRAIITCDVPGCRETVFEAGTKDTEGLRFGLNGILCPPRDADALQSALIWSINNQEKLSAMGHASRGLAERYYEANNVANEVVNFINPIKYAEMNGRSKK